MRVEGLSCTLRLTFTRNLTTFTVFILNGSSAASPTTSRFDSGGSSTSSSPGNWLIQLSVAPRSTWPSWISKSVGLQRKRSERSLWTASRPRSTAHYCSDVRAKIHSSRAMGVRIPRSRKFQIYSLTQRRDISRRRKKGFDTCAVPQRAASAGFKYFQRVWHPRATAQQSR